MMRKRLFLFFPMLLAVALVAVTGCGSGMVAASPSNSVFSISPGSGSLDTACTGCNAKNARGASVHQFTATIAGGGSAAVTWSLAGGDAASGAGTISADGQYIPPSYLTSDSVEVLVTATLKSNPFLRASAILTVSPGFSQPLTPENLALGANESATITGHLAEAQGTASISFALARDPTGTEPDVHGSLGSLGPVSCQRDSKVFTSCSVAFTAPAAIPATGVAYIVATAGGAHARTATAVLLNAAGIASNPATHQAQMPVAMHLGSSGGNNRDYDVAGSHIADCCSGTLGSLVSGPGNRLYLLSNNHVLARSDHASVGDAIVQPGLIDNNCTPNGAGAGAGVQTIATLDGWLPLAAKSTNVDAAIAQVASRAVDATGGILELGARQPDGTLAAAPPGISSTGGKGESAQLSLKLAKSGRTTGLTCGSITALDLDVTVDYFLDCAETKPYLSKTFTNQLAVSGNAFSDAGDSGALLVDSSNAEPVGLFFAGGVDWSGVSQGIANPAAEVLSELGAQMGGGASAFSFVGGADHPVSCLSYGDSTISAAQAHLLSSSEVVRGQRVLSQSYALENPSAGILKVAAGKSSDHPGEAAVIVYVDENMNPTVPDAIGGVRTVVIPSSARTVQFGTAPRTALQPGVAAPALSASALSQAISVKQQMASELMKRNKAFFAIGVGQSLDNPREAALVIYVDRQHVPAQLPRSFGGVRTRYVVMDRLHVTRSYAVPVESRAHCMPKAGVGRSSGMDLLDFFRTRRLKLD
jgi:hypothetical protein